MADTLEDLTWPGKIVFGITAAVFVLLALPFWIAGVIAYRLGWWK